MLADRSGSIVPFWRSVADSHYLLSFVPFYFTSLAALYVTMFLRSTNNSLAAGLDATSLSGQSEDLPPSTSADVEVLCLSCSDAHSPLPQASGQADVPSPAFLASVVAAV